ncbi:MAG TPA: hypothetical protein VGJ77_16115 [Gaiellaceae bacterium]|jgi:hypothetical protein
MQDLTPVRRNVCVVRGAQVVETVPEAFDALRGFERRTLTFVSAPSRRPTSSSSA